VAETKFRAQAGPISGDGRETVDLLVGPHAARRAFYLDDIAAVRDALAPFDPRVADGSVHHWTVQPDGDGEMALWAWSSADDPRPALVMYRHERTAWPVLWQAVLAGLGLEDVQ
jgi:hypothetical protein